MYAVRISYLWYLSYFCICFLFLQPWNYQGYHVRQNHTTTPELQIIRALRWADNGTRRPAPRPVVAVTAILRSRRFRVSSRLQCHTSAVFVLRSCAQWLGSRWRDVLASRGTENHHQHTATVGSFATELYASLRQRPQIILCRR